MRRILPILVSVAGLACDGRPPAGAGGDAGPSAPPVTVADYMTATRTLYCAYTTCALGFSVDAGCAVNDDFLAQIEKSLVSGRRRVDQAGARAFLAAVATVDGHACWGERVTDGLSRMVVALDLADAAAPGNVALAERCFDLPECVGGYCDLTSCPGRCVPLHAPGTPCQAHPECGPGAVCLEASAGHPVCATLEAKGDACDDGHPCADPLACIRGVCADPSTVTPGTGCTGDVDCGPDARCVAGACAFKSGIGGPCTAGTSVFPSPSPDCRGSLVCAGVELDDAGAVKREGRCAVPSESREPCYPDAVEVFDGVALNTSADGCFFGLVCDPSTRRCARGPKPGEPCLAGRCEQGAWCDGVTCHAFRAPGQRCTSAIECFGACEAGVCGLPPPNVACPAP